MPKLINLPDFGILHRFWDTWDSIQGWKGFFFLLAFVWLFQVGVGFFISYSRNKTIRERQERAAKIKKAKEGKFH